MPTFIAILAALLSAIPILAAEPARDALGDPLPDGAILRLGSTRLRAGESDVCCLALSTDGATVATGDDHGSVQVWDVLTGKPGLRAAIPGRVRTVVFSSDRTRLAAAVHRRDGGVSIAVWRLDDGAVLCRTEVRFPRAWAGLALEPGFRWRLINTGLPESFGDFAFTPDLELVAFLNSPQPKDADGVAGTVLRVVRVGDGTELWNRAVSKEQSDPLVSPDGKLLAYDGLVLDMADGRERAYFGKAEPRRWTADSRGLYAVDWPDSWKYLRLRDALSGLVLKTLPRELGWSQVVSPDESTLVTDSMRGVVIPGSGAKPSRVWKESLQIHRPTAGVVHTVPMDNGAKYCVRYAPRVAVSDDGKVVAALGTGQFVRLWNADTGKVICAPAGTEVVPWHLVFSADGTRIASANADAVVWDSRTAARLEHHRAVDDKPLPAFGPDGKFEWRAGKLYYPERTSADGRIRARLVTIPFEKWANDAERYLIRVTDADERELFARPQSVEWIDHHGLVPNVAVSSDGKLAVSASVTINLWEVPSGKLRAAMKGHTQSIHCIAFSPADKLLATGSRDRTVKLWSTADGRLLRTFAGHEGAVVSLAFSSDGKRLASGSDDTTVLIWDLAKFAEGGR